MTTRAGDDGGAGPSTSPAGSPTEAGPPPPSGQARAAAAADMGRQLQAVHRLAAASVAATTVESIYQAALDALVSSLPVQRAAVLLFDAEGVMRFRAWRGLSEGYRRAADGHSPWGRDHPGPRPVVIADAAAEAGLGELGPVIATEGIAALAFIPLLYGDRLLGKFMLYCDRPHDFSAGEVALAETVAGHITFALEKRRLEDQLRRSAETLSATLNAVGEGITVQAPDGRLLLANDAAAGMLGFASVSELLGASLAEVASRFQLLDDAGRPIGPERLPGRAALRGEELPEVLIRWRIVDTGEERFSLVRAHPVRNEQGAVRFAVNVFRDVTDRQRTLDALRASEARLAFLASASRRLLAAALEPGQVLDVASRLAVPDLADWCVVAETDGALERIAVAGRDGAARAGTECWRDLVCGHVVAKAMAGRRPLVLEEQGAVAGPWPEFLARLGARSAVVIPLRVRDQPVGVLVLVADADRPPYSEADLALAQELAGRVASSLDNARAFAREHATAETLARALLPGRLPDIPGAELAARYRAAGEVGGDFYDCFPIGQGRWMLVVGDVCGRGIQAAGMTGLTRHTIRAAALHASSPAAVLDDLNLLLLDAAKEHMAAWLSEDRSEPSFCTVCLAVVEPSTEGARATVAVAGHPLPYLLGAGGEVSEIGRPGSLLGVVADIDVSETTVDLGPGDALVLFTDGISERRHAGRFFDQDLDAFLAHVAGAPAATIASEIEDAAVGFAASAPDDDMAVLVLSVPAAALPAAAAPARLEMSAT